MKQYQQLSILERNLSMIFFDTSGLQRGKKENIQSRIFQTKYNLHAIQFPPIYKESIMFDCGIIDLKIFILQNEQFKA